MFGWSVLDIPMLAALPALLSLSGFFSGSETALFALTESERITLRRGGGLAGRAVEALLADQRMLLITVLVGNMTVNTLARSHSARRGKSSGTTWPLSKTPVSRG